MADSFIGPVRDADSAAALQRAGASVIAVAAGALPRFPETAAVDLSAALSIRSAIDSAKLCVILDARRDISEQQSLCDALEPQFVAIDIRQPEADRLRDLASSSGSKIILLGLWLDHDEDPAWTQARIDELNDWQPHAVVVTFLASLKQPVEWLREQAGSDEEDVVAEDIQKLLDANPILLNMELSEPDVAWVSQTFSAAKGTFLFLGEPHDDGGSPLFCDRAVAEALLALL